jgi:hypothetical protein
MDEFTQHSSANLPQLNATLKHMISAIWRRAQPNILDANFRSVYLVEATTTALLLTTDAIMAVSTWALAIGAGCILLGFVALLLSKIYIVDAATQTPIEFEVPFLGKLKTNYPAPVVCLIGAALVGYTLYETDAAMNAAAPDEWTITGRLVSDGLEHVEWGRGAFTLMAGSPSVDIDNTNGTFTIRLKVKKGKPLEEYLERIDFTDESMSAKIYPQKELEKYIRRDDSSLLENQSTFTRAYKPLVVTKWTSSPQ